jgi:hypothetical protein
MSLNKKSTRDTGSDIGQIIDRNVKAGEKHQITAEMRALVIERMLNNPRDFFPEQVMYASDALTKLGIKRGVAVEMVYAIWYKSDEYRQKIADIAERQRKFFESDEYKDMHRNLDAK